MRPQIKLLSVVVLLLVTFLTGQCAAGRRSGYGEACSLRQRCHPNSQLICSNSVCNCTKPNDMIFDETVSKCVVRAGEQCKYAIEEEEKGEDRTEEDVEWRYSTSSEEEAWFDSRGNIRRQQSPRIRYEIFDCVQGSSCSSTGVCICDPGLFEDNLTGHCSKVKGRGEPCSTPTECSSPFTCSGQGVCECDPSNSTYELERGVGRCVGLAGKPCLGSARSCIRNAVCVRSSSEIQAPQCVCDDGHYQTAEGRCLVSKQYNQNCSVDFECDKPSGLICLQNICKCDPQVSKFNGGRCVGLPGQTSIKGQCAENSSPFSSTSTCKCNPDYIVDTGRKACLPRQGAPCSQSSDCHSDFPCARGRCRCPNYRNQVYHVTREQCVNTVSSPCNSDNECVENARCEKSLKRCECNDGYVEFGPGFCRKTYGANCTNSDEQTDIKYHVEDSSPLVSPLISTAFHISSTTVYTNRQRKENRPINEIQVNNMCDSLRGLYCRDEICQCETDMEVFSKTRDTCVGLVGSYCLTDHGNNDCTENAECVAIDYRFSKGLGRCACRMGWEFAPNKTCVPTSSNSVNLDGAQKENEGKLSFEFDPYE